MVTAGRHRREPASSRWRWRWRWRVGGGGGEDDDEPLRREILALRLQANDPNES